MSDYCRACETGDETPHSCNTIETLEGELEHRLEKYQDALLTIEWLTKVSEKQEAKLKRVEGFVDDIENMLNRHEDGLGDLVVADMWQALHTHRMSPDAS